MISLGLNSLRGHFVRFIMTALSVALGVAFVTGTFIFSDNLNASLDSLIKDTSKGTDVYVRAQTDTDGPASLGQDTKQPLSFADDLAKIDGVKTARPEISGSAILVDAEGVPMHSSMTLSEGYPIYADDPIARLTDGRLPTGSGEIVVEDATLDRSGHNVGDQAEVVAGAERVKVTIVGVADPGDQQGSSVVYFPADQAQKHFAPDGTASSFVIQAADGVDQQTLADRVSQQLPDGFEAITGQAYQDETSKMVKQGLQFVTYFFLIFAAVALIVGVFIIVNTFLMLLAQRTKELAMLRAMGTKRRQIVSMVLVEALIIGVIGTVLGFGLGIGLFFGVDVLTSQAMNLEPTGQLHLPVRTPIVAAVVGICITLIAALVPAIISSRTPPVAAMRSETTAISKPMRIRSVAAAVVLAAGAGLAAWGLTADSHGAAIAGIGCALLFVGVVLASAPLVKPLVGLMTAPAAAAGSVPQLARDNTVRNPRRTALTGSALMIGLALVSGVGVLAASATASTKADIDNSLKADFVISSVSQGLPSDLTDKLQTVPGVKTLAPKDYVILSSGEDDWFATSLPADSINKILNAETTAGSLDSLADGKLVVSDKLAEKNSWSVGDSLTVTMGEKKDHTLVIGGIIKDSMVAGEMLISQQLAHEVVPESDRDPSTVYGVVDDGADVAAVAQQVQDEVNSLGLMNVETLAEHRANSTGDLQVLLSIIYGLLGLSIIIAGLGIANTLGMSVYERTREIGMLRAVGLKRRQLWNMVVLESIWTALFGAVLGAALGTALGVIGQRLLADQGMGTLGIPWVTITLVLVGSALLGVIASLTPAFRASRLNVLDAIATS